MKYAKDMRKDSSSVPLSTYPECVIDRVIAKFAEKGIEAEHSFNEHTPKYDRLHIKLSTIKI